MSAARFWLRRDRVVNAGAGTGKTHALVTQYLHLATGLGAREKPVPPRQICALTFTDKAAAEMRERVERRARAAVTAILAHDEPGGTAAALARTEPDLYASAQALGRAVPGLDSFRELLAQLPGAPIGTFHSFSANLLRRHGAAAGVEPDFALLDDTAARDLLTESAERIVLDALTGLLGPELCAAAERVTAEYGFRGAPGGRGSSGLVEALCALLSHRAEEGKGAAGIADSFGPDALAAAHTDLGTRAQAAFAALTGIQAAFGGKSGPRVAEALTLAPPLYAALADPDALPEAESRLARIRAELKSVQAPRGEDADPAIGTTLNAVRAELKAVATALGPLSRSYDAVPLARGIEALLTPVAAAYAAAKQAQGALDFADLLTRARDLLRSDPTARAAARARFAVFLVDEFQDTNPLQAELIGLLTGLDGVTAPADGSDGTEGTGGLDDIARPPDAGATGDAGTLYLVGDRKQSIYEFRGADVAAYAALCDRLLQRGADAETLSVSRRSSPGVLRLVNALFARVLTAPASELQAASGPAPFFVVWDEARDALQPLPERAETGTAAELLGAAPAEPAGDADPDAPADSADSGRNAAAADAGASIDREAALIARRICALHADGTPYRDVTILLRRFTHLLRYTAALKRAGIPHYVVRGRGFYKAQEILDIAAFFTLLEDESDRVALLAVLRSPLCGLSDETLVRLHLRGELRLPALLRSALPPEPAPPRDPAASTDPDPDPHLASDEDPDDLPPLELLDTAADLAIPADEQARLVRLVRLVQALRGTGERIGPSRALRALLDGTDYCAVLAAADDAEAGKQRLANLQRLAERALAFEERGGLRAFTRALRLSTDPQFARAEGTSEPAAQLYSEADDVVRVMTVHQAKGLEFPVVVVAGCAGREPSFRATIGYDRDVGLGLRVLSGGERVDTLPSLRVKTAHAQRAAAESARLFYVATTRARDRVIFAGEAAADRRAPSTSWRGALDALIADAPARPDAAPLLLRWAAPEGAAPGGPGTEPEPAPAPPSPSPPPASPAVLRGALTRALSPPAFAAAELRAEGAADFVLCPRRYHLRHTLALGERSAAAPVALGGSEQLLGGPLGTPLAARLLAEADPALSGRDLPARLAAAGHDLEHPAVGELLLRLQRFAESRSARALARPAVRRGLAFRVAASDAPGAPILRGRLDALWLEPSATDPTGLPKDAHVLAYRYEYAPDTGDGPEARAAAERLRAEQAALALVARRLVPAAAAIHVGLCFLREPSPEPHVHTAPPADVAALADGLTAAAALVALVPAEIIRLPILPIARCSALGCGYRPICHRREQA